MGQSKYQVQHMDSKQLFLPVKRYRMDYILILQKRTFIKYNDTSKLAMPPTEERARDQSEKQRNLRLLTMSLNLCLLVQRDLGDIKRYKTFPQIN